MFTSCEHFGKFEQFQQFSSAVINTENTNISVTVFLGGRGWNYRLLGELVPLWYTKYPQLSWTWFLPAWGPLLHISHSKKFYVVTFVVLQIQTKLLLSSVFVPLTLLVVAKITTRLQVTEANRHLSAWQEKEKFRCEILWVAERVECC